VGSGVGVLVVLVGVGVAVLLGEGLGVCVWVDVGFGVDEVGICVVGIGLIVGVEVGVYGVLLFGFISMPTAAMDIMVIMIRRVVAMNTLLFVERRGFSSLKIGCGFWFVSWVIESI
jgi:hypothetical protein